MASIERSVILLRGINVGGRHRLPMAELRHLVQAAGGTDVETYIQSGNAVARGAIDPDALADAISDAFGFRPSTLVLDADRFRAIADACPFDLADGKATHIGFPLDRLSFDLERARAVAGPTERVAATDAAVYLHLPDGMARSKLGQQLDLFANTELTLRNGNTVNKLITLLFAR